MSIGDLRVVAGRRGTGVPTGIGRLTALFLCGYVGRGYGDVVVGEYIGFGWLCGQVSIGDLRVVSGRRGTGVPTGIGRLTTLFLCGYVGRGYGDAVVGRYIGFGWLCG